MLIVAIAGNNKLTQPPRKAFAACLTAGLVLLLLGACATSKPPTITALEEPPIDQSLPMIGLQAYRSDNSFFIQYQLGERAFYSGGDWQTPLMPVTDGEQPSKHYGSPTVVPLRYRQSEPWDTPESERTELPIYPVELWRNLRNRLLRALVPAESEGIVIDFGHTEYFLYYDPQQLFHATRIQDKPSNYSIKRVLRFDEFVRLGRPILRDFLIEHEITAGEFVFNTGDTGLYALPFIYINTEAQYFIFLRNDPLVPVALVGIPGLQGGQAVGHVMRSHLTNLLVRPVSSLNRLFFALSTTAVSTLRFDWAAGLADKPVPELANAPPMDLQQWEQDLEKIARNSSTSGTIEFLIGGDQFFPRFLDEVSRARQSVRLQTYIFDNDDYAVTVGTLLKRRSNEGIDIKVLLDGFGTIFGTMSESESLPADHQAPGSVSRFLEAGSEVAVRQKSNPWFTGDHVKSTIIDQRIAYVGGMNIGREYRYDWHDLMMELRGPVVDEVTREFDVAWGHAGPMGDFGYLIEKGKPAKPINPETGQAMRILTTGPGNYEIFTAQVEAIRRAQSYIYVQNAYFTDDILLRELVLARRRGVDVRVIIPMETDHGPITRSNVLAANLMLEHGIRVYIYPGFSHVKAAVYDGWICVGSANFDRLSLRLNRELNIASSDPATAAALNATLFEPDFQNSPELTEPIPKRWVDYLVETVGDFVY